MLGVSVWNLKNLKKMLHCHVKVWEEGILGLFGETCNAGKLHGAGSLCQKAIILGVFLLRVYTSIFELQFSNHATREDCKERRSGASSVLSHSRTNTHRFAMQSCAPTAKSKQSLDHQIEKFSNTTILPKLWVPHHLVECHACFLCNLVKIVGKSVKNTGKECGVKLGHSWLAVLRQLDQHGKGSASDGGDRVGCPSIRHLEETFQRSRALYMATYIFSHEEKHGQMFSVRTRSTVTRRR
jgi:hypothetical protein